MSLIWVVVFDWKSFKSDVFNIPSIYFDKSISIRLSDRSGPENSKTRGFLTNPTRTQKKFLKPDPNPKKPEIFFIKILVNTGYILLISSTYLSKKSNADSMEPFFNLLVVK